MGSLPQGSAHRLAEYCAAHRITTLHRLGFGKDGSVWLSSRGSAIKTFERRHAYTRERDVYLRLASYDITHVVGHAVPEMLKADDARAIIEMSVVEAPFVLDFASAQLDHPIDFPEEVLAEWFAEKREQFGADWPKAVGVLRALERMGIFMTDVHPGNIKFR